VAGNQDENIGEEEPQTITVKKRMFGRLAVPFSFEAVPLVTCRFWYYLELGGVLYGGSMEFRP
jgi:hypothetical protein